jgi:hypothetical protein
MTEDKLQRKYGGGLQAIDFSDLARQIERAKKRNRILKQTMAGLVVVALVLAGRLYDYFVLRYAIIEDVKIFQDTAEPKKILYRFKAKTSGIVKAGYEKAICEDIVTQGSNHSFHWSWTVHPAKREFTFYLRSRGGILPTTERKSFSVSKSN